MLSYRDHFVAADTSKGNDMITGQTSNTILGFVLAIPIFVVRVAFVRLPITQNIQNKISFKSLVRKKTKKKIAFLLEVHISAINKNFNYIYVISVHHELGSKFDMPF